MSIDKMWKVMGWSTATWCLSLLLFSCAKSAQEPKDLAQYVDPLIGTGGHGHVFLGANVPFGMVQLGPTQLSKGWDWCSGYHYSDSTITGFGHTHLSGTGIGDLGDIALMPVTGEVVIARGTPDSYTTGFYSKFGHDQEQASPGYYKVQLERYGITAELTATSRTGFHRYQYPEGSDARVVFDLQNGIGWDSLVQATIECENDSVISGYRYSSGWARDQKVYFTALFSKKIEQFQDVDQRYAVAHFGKADREPLSVKVALSAVSVENAKQNLQAEHGGWNFTATAEAARQAWNAELNKIEIETPELSDKKIFYTALYHSMVAPSLFSDVNGDYRGADGKIHTDTTFIHYTTLSLWDTYRAAHPLATIIHPEKMGDYAQTFLSIFEQQGKLPVWHLVGNETDCMVGNPGIPVLADILLKGYPVDKELALQAMITSAMLDERELKWLKEYGYIPYDKAEGPESVAKGMEYALADWCVAQTARHLNNEVEYNYFSERAQSYKHYFDKNSGFMRARSSDSRFKEPFNPFRSAHMADDYTEGNGWQYTWLVPHDVQGLIELFGGESRFVTKLDSLFTVSGDLGESASPDISGLIGQYAHGNEPSHHILYMYAYLGQQWKTAEKVRQVLTTLYRDQPDGICGNEDVGQMSAWYLLSSLGFYQVEPAGGTYVFGSPLFDKATIRVGNGKTFQVVARNNSRKNCYIQRATLNGKPYTCSFIRHQTVMEGGVLEFEMGDKPALNFATNTEDRP